MTFLMQVLFITVGFLFTPLLFSHHFGTESRIQILSEESPWTSIGRLDGSSCTATLLSPTIAVTTANCIIDSATGKIKSGQHYFYPNLREARAKVKSLVIKVRWGGSDFDTKPDNDWALLVLENDLSSFGNMGTDSVKWTNVNRASYGYEQKKPDNLWTSFDCQIRKRVGNRLYHDCASYTGMGAPIFIFSDHNLARLVGIDVGFLLDRKEKGSLRYQQWHETVSNIAISERVFAKDVLELKAEEAKQIAAGNRPKPIFHQ